MIENDEYEQGGILGESELEIETTISNPITERIKANSDWFTRSENPEDLYLPSQNVVIIANTIPQLCTTLRDSEPNNLIENIKKNIGMVQGIETAMVITGIGGTPLRSLWRFIFEKLNGNLVLNGVVKIGEKTTNYSYTIKKFGKSSSIPTNIAHNRLPRLSNELLEDILNILCFAYCTDVIGGFSTWKRCNLASFCGLDLENIRKIIDIALISANSQMAGKRDVETGQIAERKVENILNKIVGSYLISRR